jgi:signal transduction histidine kinase
VAEVDHVVGLAHDLRSPLNAVLFLAETLLQGHSGPVTLLQHRQLSLIYAATLGLSAAANDIVELARGGEQLMERDPVPFSIVTVVEGIRHIVLPIAEQKQIGIKLTAPVTDLRLGHPMALSRILLNLTTNALKFSERGIVELGAKEVGPSRVEFTVCDRGKGLDPAIQAILSGDAPARAGKQGHLTALTGFGLAICQRLARAMGSELCVRSRAGGGTSISLQLHLPPAPAGDAPEGWTR